MALTQMALDSLDFDATVALATKVAPHVDILEIGTPCIKHNGIKLLETLRAKFPKNQILVDLKTMDAGEYEAEPFYKAGADICTVLGASGIATIKGVRQAPPPTPPVPEDAGRREHLRHLENRFRTALGTKVSLDRNQDGTGKLVVHFYNDDDLESIYRLIAGEEHD